MRCLQENRKDTIEIYLIRKEGSDITRVKGHKNKIKSVINLLQIFEKMKIYNKVNIIDSNNDRMLLRTTNNSCLKWDFKVRNKERETHTKKERLCQNVFRHENVEL